MESKMERQPNAMADNSNIGESIPFSSNDSEITGCIPMCSTEGGVSNCVFESECNPIKDDPQQCVQLCYPTSPAPLPADTPPSGNIEIARKLLSEALGTCLLVLIVVGSGISGESLSDDVGVQLLINAMATTAGLYGLITIFGPVSGAHFNPVVSMVDCLYNDMSPSNLCMYSLAQILGGIAGSIVANIQYDIPIEVSSKERFGYELWISEVIATATLILVIHGCIRTGQEASVPFAVSAWVGGGYFFTSSSIFANPAVTIARTFTSTFAGIEPQSAFVYICFQLIGAVFGYGLCLFFYPRHMQPLKNDDVLYRRACVLVNKDFFMKESY
jgi:glycerol uptake facilitator-like aquaporin